MTPLRIEAFLAPAEHAAMIAACQQLSEALCDDEGRPWPVELTFADVQGPATAGAAPLVVASPLAELFPLDRPMDQLEALWRERLRRHLAAAGCSVLLCTVFRAGPPGPDRQALIERIRRVNLMVADLSCDTGASVADIDRALAFYGAVPLQTDYRLGGRPGAEAAGHAIAAGLLDLAPAVPPERLARAVRRHGGLHQLGAVIDRRLRAQSKVN